MFITLKASAAAGRTDPIMEQVASKSASNGKSASQPLSRLSRRPACVSCQKRKLRCTGSLSDCDRCKIRAIPCVPSGSRPSQRSGTSRSPDGQDMPESHADLTDSGMDETLEAPRLGEEFSQSKDVIPIKDSAVDFSLSDGMQDVLPSVLHDFNETVLYLGNDDSTHIMGQLESNTFGQLSALPTGDALSPSTSATRLLSGDSPLHPPLFGSIGNNGVSELVPSDTNTPNGSIPPADTPSTCSCVPDTLRVVQQLDDDDFKLTSLAFDQVVQLQKWIMLQCCKPLDCASCRTHSTALTVVLIICDRLTEMFECIHKRLLKAAQRVHEHSYGSSSGHSSSATTPETVADADNNRAEQLFCSTCGLAASKANCNPDLFSVEFQNLYSDEEQVHMIQALTRLQIRNFRGLLSRVEGGSQGTGGVARRLKIEALTARLTRAAANIEAVW